MEILALDFDGVICDSVNETAAAGWKSAARLWPNRFQGPVPPDIVADFRQVRPVMATGYESILLVRLLREGRSVNTILTASTTLFSSVMVDESLTIAQLAGIFGQTRDAWMADDPQNWLHQHTFYEGVVEAVNQSEVPVYIITTKEKRFTVSLRDAAELQIPDDHIFGLECGPKSDIMAQLFRDLSIKRIHFVEDRLQTLIETLGRFDDKVRFYLAEWGYNGAGERELAGQRPDIEPMALAQFPRFVQRLSKNI